MRGGDFFRRDEVRVRHVVECSVVQHRQRAGGSVGRSSGAGGQHINKTDSAVRLTHIPTGIVVQCQDGRSQHSNRDVAWKRLRSRLYDHEMRKRQEEQQKLEDSKTDVGWGHQIRSYVLDNSRIKDLRTNVEISATQKVLDGDLGQRLERPQCQRAGLARDDLGGMRQLFGGLELALGGDDLGPALTLGLVVFGIGLIHAFIVPVSMPFAVREVDWSEVPPALRSNDTPQVIAPTPPPAQSETDKHRAQVRAWRDDMAQQ